jgi:hypothetical protein
MGANDEHWLRLIEGNRSLKKLFVGLYGGTANQDNHSLIGRTTAIGEARSSGKDKLVVAFFDAATAKVWG